MEGCGIFFVGKVKELIKHQQEKYNWEFIFHGGNIDAENSNKMNYLSSSALFILCEVVVILILMNILIQKIKLSRIS